MRFYYSLVLLFLVLFLSCQPEVDNSLCTCIEAGDRVNQLSASFFNRDYSELGKDSLDQVIQFRDSICAPFIEMHPNDLQALKSSCTQLTPMD